MLWLPFTIKQKQNKTKQKNLFLDLDFCFCFEFLILISNLFRVQPHSKVPLKNLPIKYLIFYLDKLEKKVFEVFFLLSSFILYCQQTKNKLVF